MYRAASVLLYDEPHRTLDEMLALVDAIDPDTVQQLARQYLAPEAQTVLTLGPKARPARKATRRTASGRR